MPVRKVPGGWQWGRVGKVYPDRESAERQGRAIYAKGWREKKGVTMPKTKMTKYELGINFIAFNDEPSERETTWIVDMISVQTLAAAFEKDPMQVAMDVVECRERHDI